MTFGLINSSECVCKICLCYAHREVEPRNSKKMNLNDLNDDCFLEIFKFLTKSEKFVCHNVCRRWRDFLPQFWTKSLDIRGENLYCFCELLEVHPSIVPELMENCGPHLKTLSLDFQNVNFETENSSSIYFSFGPYTFEIRHCQLYNVLESLAESAKNVTSLTMKLPKKSFDCKYCRVLQKLVCSNESLEWLGIEGLFCFTPYMDESIQFENFPKFIRRLKLSHVSFETGDHSFCELLKKQSSLRSLKLENSNVITPKSLAAISSLKQLTILDLKSYDEITCELASLKLLNLQHLNIDGFVDTMDDTVLIQIAKNCRNIQRLQLTNCEQITSLGVSDAVKSLPNLAVLHIIHINISSITLHDFQSNLRVLMLDKCWDLSAEALYQTIIKNMLQMEELSIGMNVYYFPGEVTSGDRDQFDVNLKNFLNQSCRLAKEQFLDS